MSVACTTWSGRSSTTPSTRPWPATPGRSRCASSQTAASRNIDDGRGVPGRHAEADRPGRPRGRAHGAPRRRQVRRWRIQGVGRPPRRGRELSSTHCPRGCASRRPVTARSGPRSTSAASPRVPCGRRSLTWPPRHDHRVHARLARSSTRVEFIFETIAQRVARVGLPHQGCPHPAGRRARRRHVARSSFYFEGGLVELRAAPQQGQGDAQPAAHRHRAAGWHHDHRGRHPVQRRHTPRRSLPLLTISTRSTAARTSRASAPRSPAPSTTGLAVRGSSRTPRTTSRAMTSARV